MTDILRDRRRFERDNRAAAEVVLQDPERYGGPDALLVQWARARVAAGTGNRLVQICTKR